MMPFSGGLTATANAALLFSLAAAFLYFFLLEQPPSWRRTAAKTMSVLLLAILAFHQGGPALLVAALLCSAAGDAFLAQNGERPFLGGLASFLLAHVLYVVLFASTGEAFLIFAETWRPAAAVLMLLFVGVLLLRLWARIDATLRIPVAAYAAAILAMGISALTLPVPLVILGAALFMVSDGLLAAERFMLAAAAPHRAWSGRAVWLLYYAAQLAITGGVLWAD
jgi:uncharacterized membrane protein YhhN